MKIKIKPALVIACASLLLTGCVPYLGESVEPPNSDYSSSASPMVSPSFRPARMNARDVRDPIALTLPGGDLAHSTSHFLLSGKGI